MGLTGLDMAVLIAVLGLGGLGMMRGMIAEATSFAAWFLAIAAVRLLYSPVAAWLAKPVGTESGAAVLAVGLIFGATYFLVTMTGARMGSAMRGSFLGSADRLLGFGVGALKGLLLTTIGFLLFNLYLNVTTPADADRPEWMTKARSYPLLRATSGMLLGLAAPRTGR